MNVCTRGRSESRTASAARSMSAACARARPAMIGPCTSRAIVVRPGNHRRGDRESSLDHVDAEPRELLRDLQLLGRVQRDARRLLAVSQGGVKDDDPVGVHGAAPFRSFLLLLRCEFAASGRHANPPDGGGEEEGKGRATPCPPKSTSRVPGVPGVDLDPALKRGLSRAGYGLVAVVAADPVDVLQPLVGLDRCRPGPAG